MKDHLEALLSLASEDLRAEHWLSEEGQREYAMAREHCGQLWDELWEQLSEEQKGILNRYGENSLVWNALEEQLFFCQGVALGVKLMLACLT